MAAKALNMDQATTNQLSQLLGFGKTFSQLIIQWREEKGSIYFEDLPDNPALQMALHSLIKECRVFFQPFRKEDIQPIKVMEEPSSINNQLQMIAEAVKHVQRDITQWAQI